MKIYTHSFNFGSATPKPATTPFDFGVRIVLLIFAVISISAILFLGIERVSTLILPVVIPCAYALVAIFLFGIYPLSSFNSLRIFLKIPSVLIAYGLGACAWIYSLIFVIKSLGFWGILFCLFFQTLTPITILGAIFKGSWNVVGHLAVWLIFSFIIRMFSLKLSSVSAKESRESNVIDVEIVKTQDSLPK